MANTNCSWWCFGRWWAQRATFHPTHAAAWQSIKAVKHQNLHWSEHVRVAITKHLETMGLSFTQVSKEKGLLLHAPSGDDYRVKATIANLSQAEKQNGGFWSGSPEAEHALRVISRIRLLNTIQRGRNDAEGHEHIDPEVASHNTWTKWTGTLDQIQRCRLNVWRSGAISTPTRRGESKLECNFCKAEVSPSARHYWSECAHFQNKRQELSIQFRIGQQFWTNSPRVVAKTGWITLSSAQSIGRRAELQVAACTLGLSIMRELQNVCRELPKAE